MEEAGGLLCGTTFPGETKLRAIVKRFHHIIWVLSAAVMTAMPLAEHARAQSGLLGNLQRSRDALLTQRGELQDASSRIGSQINELQRQQERVDAYLRDTDRALQNVESALRSSP